MKKMIQDIRTLAESTYEQAPAVADALYDVADALQDDDLSDAARCLEKARAAAEVVAEFARDTKTPAEKHHARGRTGEWVPPPLVPEHFPRYFGREPTDADARRWVIGGSVTNDTGPVAAVKDEG